MLEAGDATDDDGMQRRSQESAHMEILFRPEHVVYVPQNLLVGLFQQDGGGGDAHRILFHLIRQQTKQQLVNL